MKWFDKWIEKMYLKKHPMPTASFSVRELKPVNIMARTEVDMHDLYNTNIDMGRVRTTLLQKMLPDIENCMILRCSEDIASNTVAIEATLTTYREDQGYEYENGLKINYVTF